jgi:hypothetical protein
MAFGIPTCEEEFLDAKESTIGRDFVIGQNSHQYDVQFLSYLRKIEPKFIKLKVKTVHKLTLEDFGRLFQDSSNKVVILFTHWKDNTVEFFDGMATLDEIIKVIPNNFDGIVDLCVCHPENLAIKIRNHLPPTSLIRYTEVENTPYKWLYFYWAVFTILDESDLDESDDSGSGDSGCSYLEALEKAVEAFAKRIMYE